LTDTLCQLLRPGDLLLTLGAGDITQVGGEVLAKLGPVAPPA
jgi:UDP-N-acetylmuramate--alanine ligase